METIASGDRTQSLTRSVEHSTINSSVRTTRSLESFFRANTEPAILEMAGNISRNTAGTKESYNAFKKCRNSQITVRIVRDNEAPEFRENAQAIQQREKVKKLFSKLQSDRNVSDFDKKKSLLELNLFLPEAPYKLRSLDMLGLEKNTPR